MMDKRAAYEALATKHGGKVFQNASGQILAMQDARKWTAAMAMEIVSKNIEAGNAQAIEDAGKWMGRA